MQEQPLGHLPQCPRAHEDGEGRAGTRQLRPIRIGFQQVVAFKDSNFP